MTIKNVTLHQNIMPKVAYAEYRNHAHSAECHYAECHYAECHYAECHCAECHYAELLSAAKIIF